MSSTIDASGVQSSNLARTRRAELESQLHLAIKRAEKNYRQVDRPVDKPSVNPSHLGLKIDIRV